MIPSAPGFSQRRTLSIAKKELRHILRDPFTMGFAFLMPLLMVIFFGYAIDFDVKDVQVELRDGDRTRASRELAEILTASGYFRLNPPSPGLTPAQALASGKAKAVLSIQPGFSRGLSQGRSGRLQLDLDGADNQTASTVMGYLSGVQGAASRRLAPRSAPVLGNGRALTLETRYLFNPTLDTHRFIIPGLIALVTGMLGVLLTALTVAREWETGSMELLLSTPVRPLELVLGKLTPYLALATLAITVVYLLVRVAFSTGFAGSHALFFIAVLLYILLCLSQGLLISVGARNQALAMQLGITTGLLPPMMLSGFIFPVESMPLFFRALTTLLPARWFVTIIRALWLKGSTALELALPFSILLAMTLVLVALAATRLKTDLEP